MGRNKTHGRSHRKSGIIIAGLVAAAASSACRSDNDDSDTTTPFPETPDDREDLRALIVATPPPPPMTGASITVIDESRVVLTDPDRDLVYVVGPAQESAVRLPAGARPWRAVVDGDGRAHVALRGIGAVATIDVSTADLLAVRSVCPTLRGIGLRAAPPVRDNAVVGESLVVACAGGEVISLPIDPTDDTRTVITRLDPDLRDVIVDEEGQLLVTRFRSAEVLTLDDAGGVVDRTAPPPWLRMPEGGGPDDAVATARVSTAWRTIAQPGGGWVMVHQAGSDRVVDPDDDETGEGGGSDDGGGGGGGSGYGSGSGGDTCGSLVSGAITRMRPDGVLASSGAISGALLPVDVALHPDGNHVAIAVGGSCDNGCFLPQIIEFELDQMSAGVGLQPRPCVGGNPILLESGAQVVAVAYSPGGRLWALQREPAMIHRFDGDQLESVSLSDISVEDTGHRLFHESGQAGLACASCHPEGGDDGLLWNLPNPVHTPALDVGLVGTEPFHWHGDLADFSAVVHEVHERRMGESLQSDERIGAFATWVTRLRATPPAAMNDDAEAGRALFVSYGCASCHGGASTTNNQTVAVGSSVAVQVPSLHGVALHPPYMHDARSATLADAVRDMIVSTRPGFADGSTPDDADVGRMIAYLETL